MRGQRKRTSSREENQAGRRTTSMSCHRSQGEEKSRRVGHQGSMRRRRHLSVEKEAANSLEKGSWDDHYLPLCRRRQNPGRCCCSPGCACLAHPSQHLHTPCHRPQPGSCEAWKHGFRGWFYGTSKEKPLTQPPKEEGWDHGHKGNLHGLVPNNG